MTKQDFAELYKIANQLPPVDRLGVFSPIRDGERKLFPKAIRLPQRKWDLNEPSKKRFDVLIAANVFMYSPDPAKWFRNVLASCRYFILLDLVRRRRGASGEFGSDGDSSRFAVGANIPRTDSYFDLADLGDRVLATKSFFGGANEADGSPLHFIAIIRGDLAEPVIRIDDYPTGIRPILPDLSPIHDVIGKFETARLPYHLGIVPSLLTDEMFEFLEGLNFMIPVVHGYDHSYPKYAPILEKKDDIYNQKTVGVFNEFSGQSFDEILGKLTRGRALLEDRLDTSVTSYIPPCNIGDRNTARALEAAGYERYFSEKRIPGCSLPWIRSDFYGRSPEYPSSKSPTVSTFHTTWEWDVVREGNTTALDLAISTLQKSAETERHVLDRMKEIVSS